jgi:hypothetical protein
MGLLGVDVKPDRAAIPEIREVGDLRQRSLVPQHPKAMQVYSGHLGAVVTTVGEEHFHVRGAEERSMFPRIVKAANGTAWHCGRFPPAAE